MAIWTEIVHGKVIALYEFLQENRQICDAHTVDFFTEDHWTGIVPDGWKEALLSSDINHESFLNPENMKQCNIKQFNSYAFHFHVCSSCERFSMQGQAIEVSTKGVYH